MNLDVGPIYNVPLIQSLQLGINGGMLQKMPSRSDLVDVRQISERVVAGYEVLLSHYRAKCAEVAELKSQIERLKDERRD